MSDGRERGFCKGVNRGVVVHEHDGAPGFHDPSRKHNGILNQLHNTLDQSALRRPEGWDGLSAAEQDQYAQALEGQTFWRYPDAKVAKPTQATQPLSSAVVINRETPHSHLIHVRRILRDAKEYLYWADPHFITRALEELLDNINSSVVHEIRILSGENVFDLANPKEKARREFKRFADEMRFKGVRTEWRILGRFAHDRIIMSREWQFNVPPVRAILEGQYSEILKTPNRPPFEDWWIQAKPL